MGDIFGNPGDDRLLPSWSAATDSKASRPFTMASLQAAMERIRARPAMPSMMILPPAPEGMSQRDRRRRRVRLANGMMLELPDGMHPLLFQMASPEEQVSMLNRWMGVEPAGMLEATVGPYNPKTGLMDIQIHESRAVPPGTVYMVNRKPYEFLEKPFEFGSFQL